MSGRNSFRTRIIGLTGGIAAGKNFVAEIFAKNGAWVFDADKEVHQIMESDKSAIAAIKKEFPQSFVAGKIDRTILRKIVLDKKEKLMVLENIIHPLVRRNYQKFLKKAQEQGAKLVLLNMALLHEAKYYECDKIIAVTASPSIQKKRFIARERKKLKTTDVFNLAELEQRFAKIVAKQMTNQQQKQRADFVINTNQSKKDVELQVKQFLQQIESFIY